MTKLYARCCGGARIHEAAPHGNWKILTILGAMSTRGMIATMTIEEATDTDIFLAYLDQVLCPALRPGDVVAMDNLSAHKVQEVQLRIEAAGAEWIYLPPYLPDLNPIEKAWSKLKQLLRTTRARTREALDLASLNCSHRSHQRMRKHGSDYASALHSKSENALVLQR
jgi:transposase